MISQRDVILISFPFSNLEESKVRPVVIVSNDAYNDKSGDFVAVPLTSNLKTRRHAMKITSKDLETGMLIVDSLVKVDKIFSVEKSLARKKIGKVKRDVYKEIKRMIIEIIN